MGAEAGRSLALNHSLQVRCLFLPSLVCSSFREVSSSPYIEFWGGFLQFYHHRLWKTKSQGFELRDSLKVRENCPNGPVGGGIRLDVKCQILRLPNTSAPLLLIKVHYIR